MKTLHLNEFAQESYKRRQEPKFIYRSINREPEVKEPIVKEVKKPKAKKPHKQWDYPIRTMSWNYTQGQDDE